MTTFESTVKLEDLIDDCLWLVFEKLDFREKIAAIRTCQKWRKLLTDQIEDTQDILDLEVKGQKKSSLFSGGLSDAARQRSFAIYGDQAFVFDQFRFDNVEKVCIRLPRSNSATTRLLKPADIAWLFGRLPRLTSLSFNQVGVVGPDDGFSLDVLAHHLPRLKSLHLKATPANWVSHVIEQAAEIETLRFEHCWGYLLMSLLEFSPAHLGQLRILWFETYSLPYLFELIRNCPELTEVAVRDLQPPKQFLNSNFLKGFEVCKKLKFLAVGFDKDEYGGWELSDELSAFYRTESEIPFKFENLTEFDFSGMDLTESVFGEILTKMPNLTSLKLGDVTVTCCCEPTAPSCGDCTKRFAQQMATLGRLRELHVTGNSEFNCHEAIVISLTELIESGQFPRLRRLRKPALSGLLDLFSGSLLAAFSGLANTAPKEAFELWIPFDDVVDQDLVRSKPRNLMVLTYS